MTTYIVCELEQDGLGTKRYFDFLNGVWVTEIEKATPLDDDKFQRFVLIESSCPRGVVVFDYKSQCKIELDCFAAPITFLQKILKNVTEPPETNNPSY